MNAAMMLVMLGSALALSLALALALEHLLWRGLLRGMVTCMEIAARGQNGYSLRALATSKRAAWQEISRVSTRF